MKNLDKNLLKIFIQSSIKIVVIVGQMANSKRAFLRNQPTKDSVY
jgi:hypothetical protein